MARLGMVIDLDRCMGCRACMEACKVENNTPQDTFWMYVFRFEEGDFPNTRVRFMPRPCMHCDNAPCVKVCPVGARFKREDGLVATDWKRCIGCRYCELACPYALNYFNYKSPKKNFYLGWTGQGGKTVPPYKNPDLEEPYGPERRRVAGGGHLKGIMEKCTFCAQRVERGRLPACVETCPVTALHFGDLDNPNSKVSQLISKRRAFRLLEELNTQPRVFYVGASPPGARPSQVEAIKARK